MGIEGKEREEERAVKGEYKEMKRVGDRKKTEEREGSNSLGSGLAVT